MTYIYSKKAKKLGSQKSHGKSHVEMHEYWSRRNFLRSLGLTTIGASFSLQGKAISSFADNKILRALSNSENEDRILVLIRLDGGNDGLNTIVQRGNDEYYKIRPSIAITEENMWNLSDEIGMPNTTISLEPLWKDGRMKVIHNVGYPQPNYSHFRSTDILASGSDSDEFVQTGWIGRALDIEFPSYQITPPTVPPAIQIGIQSSMVFQGENANLALSINNPTEFYRIAQQGQLYDTDIFEGCPNGKELKFVRQTANNAFRYSESVQSAYRKGSNEAEYQKTNIAEQLAIVARLIKGNLGTKVYMVRIGGFDTHSNQSDLHPRLLTELSEAVSAFYEDLDKGQRSNQVLSMTFSEFGRTIFENASEGTDHGTGTPTLIFGGSNLGSGFVGDVPDLVNTDQYGDPYFDVDFRSIYGSILGDWLGMPDEIVNHVLHEKPKINDLVPTIQPHIGFNGQDALLGYQTVENGNLEIRYSLSDRGETKLRIFTLSGQEKRTLVNQFHERGSFIFDLNPQKWHLASGTYLIRLDSGGKFYTRSIRIR